MINALTLKDVQCDLPAAILGGGPSLPGDLAKVPGEALLFSVNEHALQLIRVDYLVFRDPPEKFPALKQTIQNFDGLRLSQLMRWSDIDLSGVRWWDAPFSSSLATWLACWMGCNPVLLCGMDLYQGKQKYFYDRSDFRLTASQVAPAGPQLRTWRKGFEQCSHPERIKAVSGPLVNIFGKYQA